MPAIEIGRVCIKRSGREAGKKCVIVGIIDKNYVVVTGPKTVTGVKRRRANIKHLELTEEKLKITKDATDEEIAALIKPEKKPEEKKPEVKPTEAKKPEEKKPVEKPKPPKKAKPKPKA